ncbi:MAG TPA: 50S ribosomal protein L18 [Epulopiscium sp.]|nr:50S ribosomal protein L18 [Candidatus Epulonipiscium sp.]
MIQKKSRVAVRLNKHRRIRNKIKGTAARPRLAVYRSNNHIYAQIIDDEKANTLVAASTMEKDVIAKVDITSNVNAAKVVGEEIARKALAKGIEEVVFDRGGYIYHGRIQSLADAAREAGLKF